MNISHNWIISGKCVQHILKNAQLSHVMEKQSSHRAGGIAVSRYQQLCHFFPQDDMTHYDDHDFSVPGYLVEPDGYQLLQGKQDAPHTSDKLGRDSIDMPTSRQWRTEGTSTTVRDRVYARNILASNSDIRKPVLVAVTDGGWKALVGQGTAHGC